MVPVAVENAFGVGAVKKIDVPEATSGIEKNLVLAEHQLIAGGVAAINNRFPR